MRGRNVYYIAGPYSAPTLEERNVNTQRAAHVAKEVWALGHVAICPHLNTYEFHSNELDHPTFLVGDFELIYRSDGVIMLPYWEDSPGARAELYFAMWWRLPIFFYPSLPEMAS